MTIKEYDFITGRITKRPWGWEYSFTVKNKVGGKLYDDVILIPSGKTPEEEIAKLIENRLALISKTPEDPVLPNDINAETVLRYLKDEGIIKSIDTLDMVKKAMNAGV